MQPVFSQEVLARLAQRRCAPADTDCSGLQILVERALARLVPDMAEERTTLTPDASIDRSASLPGTVGEPDMGNPITPGDPNNDIDPDDNLSASDAIPPPPEMPTAWWTHMVLDPDDTPLSPEDCKLVFEFVGRRMWHGHICPVICGNNDGNDSPVLAEPPSQGCPSLHSQSEGTARLSSSEGDSGAPILPGHSMSDGVTAGDAEPGKIWNEKVDFPATIGALHEAIESIGPNAWSVFVGLWHSACGIEPPTKPSIDITNRTLARESAEGLLRSRESVETLQQPVTRQGFTSEARVARWFDRPEPVPLAWRSSLPPADADDGSWCG
jgi:hypothetical protein